MYSHCYVLCILIVMFCVFLLLCFMYSYCYVLCILIVMFYVSLLSCFMYSYCYIYVFLLTSMFCSLYSANWHSPATLTDVLPCFFFSCMANARVYLAKTGHGTHTSKLVICVILLLFVLLYALFVYIFIPYYCQRVTTQLQLTNISYIIHHSPAS